MPVTDGAAVATSEAPAHAPVADGSQKARWLRYGHPVVRCFGALAVAGREVPAVAEREVLAVAGRRLLPRDREPRHRQAIRRRQMREPLSKSLNSSWISPPILVRQVLLRDLLANHPDLFDIGLGFPVNFAAD